MIMRRGEEVSSSHYVARVVIERVDHIDVKGPANALRPAVEDTRRAVTQLANFTVRGDALTDLLTKVPKHLELIDDIDAIDPERKGNTR